jgi:hypothetical protein
MRTNPIGVKDLAYPIVWFPFKQWTIPFLPVECTNVGEHNGNSRIRVVDERDFQSARQSDHRRILRIRDNKSSIKLLGVHNVGGQARPQAVASGPTSVRPAWARTYGVKVPCGRTELDS